MESWAQLLVITNTILIGIVIVLFAMLGSLMQQIQDIREQLGASIRPDSVSEPSLPAGTSWIMNDRELAQLERQSSRDSRQRVLARAALAGSSR